MSQILKHLQDITVKFSEPGQPMVCQTAKEASVHYLNFLTNRYRFLITVSIVVKTAFHVRVPLRAQTATSVTRSSVKSTRWNQSRTPADPFSFEGAGDHRLWRVRWRNGLYTCIYTSDERVGIIKIFNGFFYKERATRLHLLSKKIFGNIVRVSIVVVVIFWGVGVC